MALSACGWHRFGEHDIGHHIDEQFGLEEETYNVPYILWHELTA
jgi:hypothetical protein